MNIYFLNTPWWVREPSGRLRRGIRAGSRWPFTVTSEYEPDRFQIGPYLPAPLFLQSAAAWAQRALPEHTVVLRDSIARGESYETFTRWLLKNPPDVVIFETGAASWQHDRNTLWSIKKKWPGCRIGVAGPTAETLSRSDPGGVVDGWIIGEYDKTSVKFIEGKGGVVAFDKLTRNELHNVPFPMFDEEVWHHYADGNPRGATTPELQLWGSRGCFAVCNFCAQPATMTNYDPHGLGKRQIRFYDPTWLEAFIRLRISKANTDGRPLTSIRFDGDTENASDKHTLAICDVMRRIRLPWSMMCRADTTSRAVWKEMHDSGCFGVKIGFESGVDRIVNKVIKKNLNLSEAANTCRYLRQLGMSVHGTFTFGLPTETEEERQQTRGFIRMLYDTNAINSHQESGTATIDGTPLADQSLSDPSFIRSPDGQSKIEEMRK